MIRSEKLHPRTPFFYLLDLWPLNNVANITAIKMTKLLLKYSARHMGYDIQTLKANYQHLGLTKTQELDDKSSGYIAR